MPTDPDRLGHLIGRELSTAVVMFHEAVGKRLGLSGTERKLLDVLSRLALQPPASWPRTPA